MLAKKTSKNQPTFQTSDDTNYFRVSNKQYKDMVRIVETNKDRINKIFSEYKLPVVEQEAFGGRIK